MVNDINKTRHGWVIACNDYSILHSRMNDGHNIYIIQLFIFILSINDYAT